MNEHLTIQPYIDKVPAEEDRVLLEEAQASLRGGALRAAYIMTWIACAESLKRRFREAQTRDSHAGKIVGEIEEKERQRKSVDTYLIQKASEYGFIQAGEQRPVEHVYEMRCLYGHPYEIAPSPEQIVAAIDTVVSAVMSKPAILRHGFIREQIRVVLSEKNYLDDHQPAVEYYADEISAKIDPSLHLWMVKEMLPKAEAFFADRTGILFANRVIWLAVRWLSRVDRTVLQTWDCRGVITANPKVYSSVLSDPSVYPHLMLAVQDTVIGVVLDWSAKAPKLMKRLERLDYAGLLSERQKERFVNAIHARPLAELQIGGLSLPYYTDKILSGLKSYTWPTQNPAAELLWNCGPSQIAQLHPETQELLGRNILQAADGSSNGAIDFLVNVTRSTDVWSTPFVSGIVTECFTNNENQYRFKRSQLGNAMLSLKRIPSSDRCRIVEAIIAGIRAAQPNGYNSGIAERDEVCTTLDGLSYDADIGSSAQELARFLRSLSGETT